MSVTHEEIESVRDNVADMAARAGGLFASNQDLSNKLSEVVDLLDEALELAVRDFVVTFYRVVECQVTVQASSEEQAVEMVENDEYDTYDVEITDDRVEDHPSGHYASAEEA